VNAPIVATSTAQVPYHVVVWRRLYRQKIAAFGIWAIAGLCIVSVFAPLICCNQPLLWIDAQGLRIPILRALFNRLLFENSVDVLFNLALLATPVWLLLYGLPRRWWERSGKLTRGRVLRGLPLAVLLIFVAISPERLGSWKNPLFLTEPIRDYVAEAAQAQDTGREITAIFPLKPYSYQDTDAAATLKAPSRSHWLGTDTEGRDVFTRLIYGGRISLTIGVVAVSIYVLIGVLLGAAAGYFGGNVDMTVSRLIEVMICIPSFFLILTIAALIEQRSIFHVMVIIGVTSWTGVARLIRAEFLKNKNLEYVQAANALGIPTHRIILKHILPNAISPVLVSATFGVASAILIESSLAFLGVGDLSVASWGEILNAGRNQGKLWLVLTPGLAIFFVVSVFNLVGEGLRDALDPKLDG
jgi:peptide/nickel transport system permease protein